MKLSNKTVELSLYTESDFNTYSEMRMSPEMMENIYDTFSLEEAKERFSVHLKPWSIKSDHWLSLTIALNLTKEKVGDIGFKVIDYENKIGEVGFMLKRGFQGKGIGYSALSLIKELAFEKLKFNKLVATCSTTNIASYSLLEKHGFSRVKILKDSVVINKQSIDSFIYELKK